MHHWCTAPVKGLEIVEHTTRVGADSRAIAFEKGIVDAGIASVSAIEYYRGHLFRTKLLKML